MARQEGGGVLLFTGTLLGLGAAGIWFVKKHQREVSKIFTKDELESAAKSLERGTAKAMHEAYQKVQTVEERAESLAQHVADTAKAAEKKVLQFSDLSRFMRPTMTTLITQVQTKLNSLGYGPVPVDGAGGPQTTAAIVKFQTDKHLAVDGILGPQTLAALGLAPPSKTEVAPTNTPLTPDQAADVLKQAYQALTGGQPPSPAVLNLLLGHTALETGNWQKMPNYNFGGVKASLLDSLIQVFTTTEVINGVSKTLKQTFAAYPSAIEGAMGYLRTLKSRSSWWNGLQSGDPQMFVTALTSPPAYFTANAGQYLSILQSRIASFASTAQKWAVA